MSGPAIAVVGAGYAGVATAVRLAEHGLKPTVFDAAAVPGGRARRVHAGGLSFDNGQHLLVGAYRELLALMEQVGVPDDAVLRLPIDLRYPGEFSLRATALPAPFGLLAGLLSACGLPWRERLGALRFMSAMRLKGFRLARDESVAALLGRYRQDGRIGRFLWRPLCVAALNTPAHDASANVFLAVLRDSLAGAAKSSDLLLPRRDLSALFPEPALGYVRARGGTVHLNRRIRSVRHTGAAFDIDGQSFDRVVLAVGPHQLERLIALHPALHALCDTLGTYRYQPIYTCYLQYAEDVRLPFPMIGLDRGLVQWVFDRGALLNESGRLACVISAQGDHQQLEHAKLAERCHRELADCLPGLREPRATQVIAEKRATIECGTALVRLPVRTPLRGLYLAGDYLDPEYPPTLEAAVRSGLRAAGECMLV